MSARIYITYEEMRGRKATDEELSALLQKLPMRSCFLELAMVNAILSLSEREKECGKVHGSLMNYLLTDENYEVVKSYFPNEAAETRPVFFRQQLLALMKRVLSDSPDEGPDNAGPLPQDSRYQLGEAALLMSDLLVAQDQEQKIKSDLEHDDALDELLVQWLPGNELSNPPEEMFALVRNNSYLASLAGTISRQTISTGEILSAYFERIHGIALDTYARLLHCVSAFYATQEPLDILANTAKLRIDMATVFSQMKLSDTEVRAFFALTARTIDDLRDLFGQTNSELRPQYDFTPFRSFPLVQIKGTVASCFDHPFLTEKIAPGLLHTIVNSLPKEDQNPFRASWGQVFHDYVSAAFEYAYPPSSGRFLDRAHFKNRSEYEAFDGLVTYGDALVVMEYKGGYLTLAAKYSGDIKVFMADFNKKFGNQEGAAIEQLGRKIEQMFNANRDARLVIPDLDITKVTTVFPVLIVQDLALRSPVMNWKARQVFGQEILRRTIDEKVVVKPLSLITIEELEFLMPYLEEGDFTMVDVLKLYSAEYRAGSYEPHHSFTDVLLGFVNESGKKRRPNQRMLAAYEDIHNSLRKLFKQGDE